MPIFLLKNDIFQKKNRFYDEKTVFGGSVEKTVYAPPDKVCFYPLSTMYYFGLRRCAPQPNVSFLPSSLRSSCKKETFGLVAQLLSPKKYIVDVG